MQKLVLEFETVTTDTRKLRVNAQPAGTLSQGDHLYELVLMWLLPLSTAAIRTVVVVFVGCLTSQQHASVSHGRICSDNCACCHAKTEVADRTFSLTQSQYTDTGPTSPGADPITPSAQQGSHWNVSFEVTCMTRPGKKIYGKSRIRTQVCRCRGGRPVP